MCGLGGDARLGLVGVCFEDDCEHEVEEEGAAVHEQLRLDDSLGKHLRQDEGESEGEGERVRVRKRVRMKRVSSRSYLWARRASPGGDSVPHALGPFAGATSRRRAVDG